MTITFLDKIRILKMNEIFFVLIDFASHEQAHTKNELNDYIFFKAFEQFFSLSLVSEYKL